LVVTVGTSVGVLISSSFDFMLFPAMKLKRIAKEIITELRERGNPN